MTDATTSSPTATGEPREPGVTPRRGTTYVVDAPLAPPSATQGLLEVDEKRAYALVEPGVSYFDLYNRIQEQGADLWIDPPDPGWGSVVGNALDGGGGWTASPFRDHFGSHCGMEIVTAEGDATTRTSVFDIVRGYHWPQEFTGRAIRNAFLDRWHGHETELTAGLAAEAPRYKDAAARGETDTIVMFAGEAVDLIHDLPPAADIVTRIAADAEALLSRPPGLR